MSRTISEHQARVFEYGRNHLGVWFTIQELAAEVNIPAGSAKRHADRFQERGVFELLKISPAQVYRMTEESAARAPELVRRIEEAIPIFAQRRKGWLEREAARLGSQVEPQPARSRAEATPATQSIAPAWAGEAATQTVGLQSSKVAVARSTSQQPSAKAVRPKKADQLIELLERPGGATLEELVAHFGTQPHSIRALISVSTRERGLKATCEGGRYRLV